jgi:hypothetical protein
MPIHSDWAGSGQRPAGLTQNLNRAAGRLAGLDSDSDDGLGRDLAGQGGPGGQSPEPELPADSDGPAAGALPAPAAPPVMPQVHTIRYTLHTATYIYIYVNT